MARSSIALNAIAKEDLRWQYNRQECPLPALLTLTILVLGVFGEKDVILIFSFSWNHRYHLNAILREMSMIGKL